MKAINNYLKNVMKSVAYAAADVSQDYTPTMHEFASANKEFATATYAALKNPTQFVRKQVEAIQESKVYKALDYGIRNASEDLRTGNFYNKARKERDELAFSGLDTSWDDLSEFGIDDDWESKLGSSSSKANDEITTGDLKVIESIEGSNAALASATVNAVITSSQNEIKNGRANTAMLYSQNERLFGGLHKDMTILGSTMQQMYKLQSASLQNIDKNMSSFFTQESKLSTERNAILKEMLEMQRNMYKSASDKEKEAASKKKSNRIRWSDININGAVDLNAYFGAVKKNINNQLATMMPAGFGEDSNMLAVMMTSPLEGAMKYVVNGVIPATVKAAAKELDASISGIFGNVIGELGNARSKNEGGILGIIAKFLGISTGVNRNIDTSRYEKGPVPFDGITRKAIIDVIPTHLRRIEAAITGRPEEMFDYKAGRWVKVANIKKQYEDIKKNAVKRATSELREAMNPGIQAVRKGIDNKTDRDNFDKAIEEFEQFIYDNNGRFNPKASASKNGITSYAYPNLYRHYSKIKTIYRDFDRIESTDANGRKIARNTKNRIRMQLSNSVLDARESEEKQYRDIESDVSNVLHSFFGIPKADEHGKWKSNGKFEAYNILKNTTDNLGNTIFDYLQNINKELTYMRTNGISGSGSYSKRKGNSKITSMDEIHKQLNKANSNVNNYASQVSERDRIAKSALEAITSGKAIDLRDFDSDEQAYLLQLSSMISNKAVTEYKSEIKGYNENAISGFMDKHFIKTNIKSLKDVDEAIKKAEKEGKNTNEVKMDAQEEKFFKKIMNRIGAGETILGGIVGASSEAFTNLLYTADKAIYEMMYKTEISDESKQKYNGFLDAMVGKMTYKFKEIGDEFKKNIIDPFKERFGIDEKFTGRFKDSLSKTGSRLWTAFKDANTSVYGPAYHKAMDKVGINSYQNRKQKTRTFDKSPQARRDRQYALADKTEEGVTSRAVLAEEMGFTGDMQTKQKMLKYLADQYDDVSIKDYGVYTTDDALNKAYIRIVENHNAKGTPSGKPFAGLTTLTKGEGLISKHGMGVVPKTGVYNITSPTHIINTEDMHSLTGGPRVSVQSALGKEKLAAKAAGFNIAHHDKGTDSIKITNKGADIDTEKFLSEAKKYIPEAASGGLIGGILSLLLGTIGGPLVGAAVGAGGSIIASSDTLKEKLFGKAGEDGKRDGSGIISKSVMNAYNKYFPDMAKYGLAGIIPGLLTPLGPVGGLLVGGALGFLKNNERFTNKYFGEEGKLTLKSKEKKIIEQMLPGVLKGAGIGAVASLFLSTPFGIVGNAAIGSALGLMASTEEFKEGILGKEINGERVGGIVNEFKDALSPLKESMRDLGSKLIEIFDKNIIDPIARFITPAIHAIPQVAAIIPRKINDYFKNKKFGQSIEDFFRRFVTEPITGIVTKFLSPITKTVTSIITSPVRLLGWAGDKIRERQIKTKNADYMVARERIDFMIDKGKADQVSGFDKALADIGTDDGVSVDDAKSALESIRTISDNKKNIYADKHEQERKINSAFNSFKTHDGGKIADGDRKKLRRAFEAGDTDEMRNILSTLKLKGVDRGLTENEINRLMGDGKTSGLGFDVKKYMGIKDREKAIKNITKEDRENAKAAIPQEVLDKLGIKRSDLDNDHEMNKIAKYLETEILDREANGVGKDSKASLETENNKLFQSMVNSLQDIRNAVIAIYNGDDETIKKLGIQHDEAYDSTISDLKDTFDFRKKENEGYIGKELTDQFDEETTDFLSANSNGVFERNKATKANENRVLIKKFNMTSKEVNACKGNVKKLSEVMALGYRIDPKDIPYYNKLTSTDHATLIKYLKIKHVKSILSHSNNNRLLTKEDIDYAIRQNLKIISNRLEWVANNTDIKQFKTVAEAMDFNSGSNYEPNSLGGKIKKGIKDGINFIFKGAKGFDNEEVEEPSENEEKPETERNGLGTILGGLFNTGKYIVKGAGSVIGSLFGKKNEGDNSVARNTNLLGSLLGAGHGFFGGNNKPVIDNSNTDEVDKAGDGKDVVHVGGGQMIQVTRDSSGNVEPDTSDSNTKTVLNKLELKEAMTTKLQEAQLKAAEIIKNNFDTSGIKESKKGKLGWLSMLLMGGLLWKSGIIQKLFNGLIKPIWTDHLKPWITNTAIPWISDKWTNVVKPWLIEEAIPAVGKVLSTAVSGVVEMIPAAISAIVPALGSAIGTLITNLPSIITSAVKAALGFGDGITGNKTNVGVETKVDGNAIVEKYGSNYETEMYDENGKILTAQDILEGNYNKIYNAQGVEGIVGEDGKVTFKDASKTGSSYLKTVGNAATNAFMISATSGRKSLLNRAAGAVGNKLISRGGLFSTVTGAAVKGSTKPSDIAENAGVYINGFITNSLKKSAVNIIKKGKKEGLQGEALTDLYKSAAHGDGSKLSQAIKWMADKADNSLIGKAIHKSDEIAGKFDNFIDSVMSKVKGAGAKKVAKEAVDEATDKSGKILPKLIEKARKFIAELFSNSTVYKKLVAVAEALGEKAPAKFIKGFKEKIDNMLSEAMEKSIKKVGYSSATKVLSSLIPVVSAVKDFLVGMDRAESILGVSETSIFEELTAGLVNAITERIFILSIVPGVEWIARKIYGIFDKNLEERQAEAEQEAKEYNEMHGGTTLTTEDYLARQKSFTGKVGGWFTDAFNNLFKKKKDSALNTNTDIESATAVEDPNNIPANAAGTMALSGYTTNASVGILGGAFGDIITRNFNFNSLDKTINKAKEGKISVFSKDYWKLPNSSDNSLKGSLENAYTMLTKIINVPMLMVKGALDGLASDIDSVGSILSGTTSNTSSSSSSSSSSSNAGTTTTFGSKLKSILSSGASKIKKFFGFGTGSYQYGTGIYSKQIDPSVAGIRFNASGDTEYQTIGNSGCGPAAAVNVIESVYGRGNAVASAAQFAINHGYKETDGGTKPGFFADYFNRNGLNSQTSYNKASIERNINSGMPTVIMGHDAKGTSSSTPFGKTPHYVTVTGTDGKGNAIVQDPESRYDNQLYPIKSLMKNTSLGVSAFGKKYKSNRNRFGNHGLGKWGKGKSTIVFIGDSRGVMLKSAIGSTEAAKHVWAVKGAMGFKWMRDTGVPSIESQIDGNKAVVIMMGVNDLLNPDWYTKYADYINSKAEIWTAKGADVYYVSVLPVGPGNYVTKYGRITNDTINTWNANIQTVLSDKVKYMDVSGKLGSQITTYDNVHYPHRVSKLIYQCILNAVTGADTSALYSSSLSTSSSSTSSSSSDTTTYEQEEKSDPTLMDVFSSIVINSRAGQAINKLMNIGSGSGTTYGRGKHGRSKWGRGNAEQIWWYLKQMGMTDAGAAGMMGNIEAESGLKFNNVENLLEKRLGYKYNDETYTAAVDSGEISRSDFIRPLGKQYGYGLVQWTSPGRKEGLYDLVKSKNVSISDPGAQLEWLGTELTNSFSSVLNVLKTTNSLQEASDIVLSKFERPNNWQAQTGSRASMGQKYYNQLKGTTGEPITGTTTISSTGTTNSSDNTSSDSSAVGFSALMNVLANSNAGQALKALGILNLSSSSSSSTNTGDSDTTNTNGYSATNASGDAAKMIELAKKEVGVTETGVNYVKYNDWYWGPGRGGPDLPWCAAFIAWLANQAGVSTDVIPRSASTKTIYNHIVSKGGKVSNSAAVPGDLTLFTKNGGASGIYHIGLITGHQNGVISTIEGNSSNAVRERSYATNDSKILVARPQYVNAGTTTNYSNSTTISSAPDYSNTRGGNGIKPLSRYGQFKDSIYGMGTSARRIQHHSKDGYSRTEEHPIDVKLGQTMKNNSRKHVYNKSVSFGMGSTPDYSKLINAIINILMTIADNTDKLNLIVTILNNKLGTSISASDVSNSTTGTQSLKAKLSNALNGINTSTSKFNTYADSIGDSSINAIISAMNAIASE